MRDDPVALRSERMCRFFRKVMHRQMARGFRAVRVLKPGPPGLPDGVPLIVYSNHPGWWDPVFCIVLQTAFFPDRQAYAPMEAAALERYRFMKRIGIFGVESDSRAGAARFLRMGEHVLSDPRRTIWMTAQGRFADPRERPAGLRPGLAHLLTRLDGAMALPLALEYPFWTEKRPEALCAFGPPVRAAGDARAVHRELETALEKTQDGLAAATIARDPDAFRKIMGGRRGIGGVYGIWSRARALAAGRRYQPDHMADGRDDLSN